MPLAIQRVDAVVRLDVNLRAGESLPRHGDGVSRGDPRANDLGRVDVGPLREHAPHKNPLIAGRHADASVPRWADHTGFLAARLECPSRFYDPHVPLRKHRPRVAPR
jgi:hypothetical protein